jgi:ElaB/YqjD/DUF883 family membrane-anchored ribosome-binding protein
METATTRENSEKVMQDLKALVHDGEQMLKAGAGELGEKSHALRAKMQSTIESAKATCQRLEEKAAAGAKAADKAIREHPYQAVGIAFGLGLLIGVLATRK